MTGSWWCSQTDLAWRAGPTQLCPVQTPRGAEGPGLGSPSALLPFSPVGPALHPLSWPTLGSVSLLQGSRGTLTVCPVCEFGVSLCTSSHEVFIKPLFQGGGLSGCPLLPLGASLCASLCPTWLLPLSV